MPVKKLVIAWDPTTQLAVSFEIGLKRVANGGKLFVACAVDRCGHDSS